jgi:sirohydrochlorin cobaltochelatase
MEPKPPVTDGNVLGKLRDAVLLLVAHGSTVNADSSEPAYRQAEALRSLGLFREVRVCFWKEQPVVSAALRGMDAARVFVVPLFISEGYFTERVIPRELGLCGDRQTDWARIQHRSGRWVHYCGVVGTHPRMLAVVLARAEEAVARNPPVGEAAPKPCETSLFLAGHGTRQHEQSRQAIEAHAQRLTELGRYRDVHSVFMEESPRIEDAYELAGTDNVVVVPFFISDGLHTVEDIPVLLGESSEVVQARLARGEMPWVNPTFRNGKRVWYGRAIGHEPQLGTVILERVLESVAAADGVRS